MLYRLEEVGRTEVVSILLTFASSLEKQLRADSTSQLAEHSLQGCTLDPGYQTGCVQLCLG